MQDQLSALADHLSRSGATVSDSARPDLDLTELNDLYVHLLRAATSRTQTLATFEHNLQAARSLDPDDRSYFAKMVRGNTLYHKDWLELDERRHRMRRKWANFFRDFDVLLCPAAASAAQPHDQLGERFRAGESSRRRTSSPRLINSSGPGLPLCWGFPLRWRRLV